MSQKVESRMEKVHSRSEKKNEQTQRNAARRAELEQAKKKKSQRELDKRENKGGHEEMSRPVYSEQAHVQEKQSQKNALAERAKRENRGHTETRSGNVSREQYRKANSPESQVHHGKTELRHGFESGFAIMK